MIKGQLFTLLVLLNSLLSFHGLSQSPASLSLSPSSASAATFQRPSDYAISWQRLLLQLSCTYFTVVNEGQVDLDSSLLYTSYSLGLSRLPVITEGFDDDDLLKKSDWVNKRDPGAALRLLPGLSSIPRLRLLVLLGAYYAFQPDANHTYADSARFFLSKAREESKSLHDSKWDRQALCLLVKVSVEGNALDRGATFFNQLTVECRAAGDLAGEAKAWMYRGLYAAYSPGTTKDRIAYLEKAQDLYHRQKKTEGEINVLMDIGYLWVSDLQLEKAEEAFRQALALEDSIGFPYTHYTTDDIAMVTGFEGKYGEPLKYSLRTVKTAEAVKDSIGWGAFYSRVGFLYSLSGNKNVESLQWMEKSMDRFLLTGLDPSLYRNLGNIVILKISDGRAAEALAEAQRVARLSPPSKTADRLDYHIMLADCYVDLKLYHLAESNYLEAARLEKKMESLRGTYNEAYVIWKLAFFYFTTGQYARAKVYFQRYTSTPSHIMTPLPTKMRMQMMLATMDSASGQYVSALRHFHQYLHLQDSNFSISKQRQVEELGIQYESEMKENDIKIRDQRIQTLVQADLLRKASLKRADLVKNITIAGILVLLIIGGLFYRQYRLKQKANLAITQKNDLLRHLLNEKEWLLKEVHHRVKNNLHTIMSLLESQSAYLDNDALLAVQNSQHRVFAMSLIHQKLYQSDNSTDIDMSVYLPDLLNYLRDSFDTRQRIRFRSDIENIRLDISVAVPIGLILNEAITNSIKYAFPQNASGEINIQMIKIAGKMIRLSIADNGIGLPPDWNNILNNSLGLKLMKGLSEDIHGRFSIVNKEGTKVVIEFGEELIPNEIRNRERTEITELQS